MPPEGSPGYLLGHELGELIVSQSPTHAVLQTNFALVDELLASSPKGIFDFVALPTTGTNGLSFSCIIRDDFRRQLTFAANDLGVSHDTLPGSDDSAA